jgi:hypothetical protein
VVRASARAMLQRSGIIERGDDIVLVLSELLANALLHAPHPGPDWPRPCNGDWLSESGRGLQVIGELSEMRGYALARPGRSPGHCSVMSPPSRSGAGS